jgi:aminoglycoside phosphotransferase (APT) family kinase protein
MSVDPFARHYSDRLGRLTGEQLQAALDRFDLGRLLAAKPTAAGLFGQNVFLSSTKGEWVLRGAPHFDWQLPKEQFFARFIHQRTDVGAPWPYQIETSTELFGWSFAIMWRLPTIEIPDEPKPQRELARAMGDALARLHEPAFEAPGAYDLALDGIRPRDLGHAEHVQRELLAWLERCRTQSKATPESDVEWALEFVESHRGALEEPFVPRYVHHDYKMNNVAALPDGGGLHVSGVFDLMEGYVGHPEEDLVRQLGQHATQRRGCMRPFLEGYARRRPFQPGARERLQVYWLFDFAVVWEFGQRNRCWFPPEAHFRQIAEPLVTQELPVVPRD